MAKNNPDFLEPYYSEQPEHSRTKDEPMEFMYGKHAREFLKHEALAQKERTEAAQEFIEKKIAEIPKRERPSKEDIKILEDNLIGASLRVPVLSLLNEKPSDFEGPILIGKTAPPTKGKVVGDSAQRVAPWVHRARFEVVWPEVRTQWIKNKEPQTYRYPTSKEITGMTRVMGGRSFGKLNKIPYWVEGQSIILEAPEGMQLELFVDEERVDLTDSKDTQQQVLMYLLKRFGPMQLRWFHYVLAKIYMDAEAEGREPDGRFYYSPSDAAELWGMKKTGGGKNKNARFKTSQLKEIDRDFKLFGKIEICQRLQDNKGREETTKGPILYSTQKEHTFTTSRGRHKKLEMRIRDELLETIKRSPYILLPVDALNAGKYDPREWSYCLSILTTLYTYVRTNPEKTKLKLTLQRLRERANITTEKTRSDIANKDCIKKLKMLEQRGLLTFQEERSKDGEPGIVFEIPEQRRKDMLRVIEGRQRQAHRPKTLQK